MKQTVLVATLVLAGCAVSPEQFRGPNGRVAYDVVCSRYVDCYKDASALCQHGYVVLQQSSTPVLIDYDMSVIHRNLTVECK